MFMNIYIYIYIYVGKNIMKIIDTYQRKNYFRDLVCFTGSDNDNYNYMNCH